MQFIDTHIHLQDYKQKCATDILSAMPKFNVKKVICVSAKEQDWAKVQKLAQTHSEVIPAFGLHPWYVKEASLDWAKHLEQYLQDNPSALIGETGLDKIKDNEKEPQLSFFKTHCLLAKKYNRPLIIHAVKAVDWLDEVWSELPQKFVFHSFNGHPEHLKKIIKSGGYVSFCASILKNKHKEEIIQNTPINKMLIETDGPYQALEKGEESDISFLPKLLQEMADIRKQPALQTAAQVFENSMEFIKI